MPGLKPEFKSYYQKLIAENPDKREDIAYGASEIHKTAHPVIFPSLDDLTAKGSEYRKAQQPGYVKTFAQGAARTVENIAGGVGALTRWGGDVAGVETISEIGKESSDYWKKATQEGWEKADEDVFQGTFMENPSIKRATGLFGEGSVYLAGALATGGLLLAGGAAPAVAAAIPAVGFGGLEAGQTYEEAREKGKSVGEASAYGVAAGVTTTALETIGIGKILKVTGSPIRGAIVGGISEGLVTEPLQTIASNLIAKFGYDKTREWNQGLAESIIGGVGLGSMAGSVAAPANYRAKTNELLGKIREMSDGGATPEAVVAMAEKFKFESPETKAVVDKIKEMIDSGVTPEEVVTMAEEINTDISKYEAPADPGAPQDMFESSGVETKEAAAPQQALQTPAGNVGVVPVDEVSPYYDEQTEQELFMEQPIQSRIGTAEESAAAFEQQYQREAQAEEYMGALKRSPQGAELLKGQLAEEQIAGEDWLKAPIESGVMPAEESAAVFEAEERKRKRLAGMSQQEQFEEAQIQKAHAALKQIKPKRVKGAKVRTLRGAIRANDGIDFGNFKGELKNMSQSVKYLSSKKGTPIDLMEKTLKEEGWMFPEESLIDKLRDDPEFLRRPHLSTEIADKPQAEKTEQELRVEEEQVYEPEEPPEGNYKTTYADELQDGAEITVLDNTGAGQYTVKRQPNGEVTLEGDRTIELTPFDDVQVLQEDRRVDVEKRKRVAEGTQEIVEAKPYHTKDTISIVEKYKGRNDDIKHITDRQLNFETLIEDIKAPEKRTELKEMFSDNLIGESGGTNFKDVKKTLKQLEAEGIPYVYERADGGNLGGLNAHHGEVHSLADKDVRKVWGEIYTEEAVRHGAVIGRDQGDEFIVVWPNFTMAEVREIRGDIEAQINNRIKEMGLDKVPHPKKKYNGMPTGALYTNYGLIEGIPGKYGEMDRLADIEMSQMKDDFELSKSEEVGYAFNKKEEIYEPGKTKQEVRTSEKRDDQGTSRVRAEALEATRDDKVGKEKLSKSEVVPDIQEDIDKVIKPKKEKPEVRTVEPKQTKEEMLAAMSDFFKDDKPKTQYSTEDVKTKTPSFKKWFKGSTVVGKSGEPMVVYHGTASTDIDEFAFDASKIGEQGRAEGAGFYFTPDKRIADGYAGEKGTTINAYLDIKKPIQYSQGPFKRSTLKKILTRAAELESIESEMDIEDGFLSNYGDARYEGLDAVINEATDMMLNEDKALDQMGGLVGSGVDPIIVNKSVYEITGHDGVVSSGFGDQGGSIIYTAFFPTQAKSTDNLGTFDPKDPRIKYSEDKITEPSKPVTKQTLEALPYVTSVTGKEDNYRIHFKNNISIPLKTVKLTDGGAYVFTPSGKKLIRGKFTPGQGIEISQAGDIRTVAHENLHFFESIGLLSGKDIRLLNRAGEKMFGPGEDKAELRAKYFEAVSKTAKPDSLVGKIYAKIKDFVAQMRQIFGRTAGGVVKDIESGKIFKEKKGKAPKTKVTAYSEAADKWYSQMSKVIGDKLPNKGTGKNFMSTIESWAKKGSFKQEELEWSGLDEFLKTKTLFSKQEVLDYLDENKVVIEELEKDVITDVIQSKANWESELKIEDGWESDIFLSEKPTFKSDWLENNSLMLFDEAGTNYTDNFIEEYGPYFNSDFIEELENKNLVDGRPVDMSEFENEDTTKYKQYQIPGGKNYKELLLTLPGSKPDPKGYQSFKKEMITKYGDDWILELTGPEDMERGRLEHGEKKEQYKSSHWDEPNVLAHVRFSERVVDAKNVLHIEELQSDWHQEGRKKGYIPKPLGDITDTEKKELEALRGVVYNRALTGEEELRFSYLFKKEQGRSIGNIPNLIPQAPWKKTWPIKTFQSMVRYATENGFDTIAWTQGAEQASRYDLSKQIDSLKWYANPDDTYNISFVKDGSTQTAQNNAKESELEGLVGKDIANKIINDAQSEVTGTYKGLDLKVGGEGMKGFYDQILPKEVNKFFNKKAWGSPKVSEIEIEAGGGKPTDYADFAEYKAKSEGESYKLWSLEITPEMKSKSLTEGMPQFSTEDEYTRNFEESKNIKGNIARNLRQIRSEVAQGLDKYLGAISTRLGNINPKLKYKMRRLSQDTDLKGSQDVRSVEPMLKKVKKDMTPQETATWDLARKNSDTEKINELVKKYGIENEYKAYRDTLDKIRKEAIDVGLDVGYIEDYAPRVLKDSRGFLEAIGKEGDWPVISRRLKERAKAMGMTVDEMNEDQKADIISNMLHGGSYGLGGVAATKERKVKKISPELNKFYMDSDAALVSHIYSMRKAIEARKFFGKVPEHVSEAKKRLNAAQKEIANFDETTEKRNKEILLKIDNLESKKSLDSKQEKELERLNNALAYYQKNRSERLQDVKDNLYEYEQLVNRYANQRDFRENIGVYVNELIEKGEIGAADEQQLIDILTARFNEQGTRGLVQAYKNLSYIDTMGSPTSALTQIGDLAWAAYEGGMIPALKNAYKASRGKSRITKEDVGVERVAQEFADAGTLGNAVSTVFKLVGLEKMDSIGKESLLNSALDKYQKQAAKNPEKLKNDIKDIFEGETDSVIQDLQNDEITNNVKFLVYNRLLDFQPAALSEMPQKYLDAGNGRIFYMLKSFTLKQFDVFRNEVYKDLKSKDPKVKIEGMKKFVKLSAFFVIANAGADELKDLVLGRKTDLEDRVVDNMLRLGGISKFVTWKARTEGVGSAMAKQILPPFKFLDAATKDIVKAGDEKGLETLASVPVFGKLAYWHMGRGVAKRGDLWDRRLNKQNKRLKKFKQDYDESADRPAYLRKYKKELADYRKIKSFKNRINGIKRRINRLKKLEQTELRKNAILKLEQKRTDMIKEYLKKEK